MKLAGSSPASFGKLSLSVCGAAYLKGQHERDQIVSLRGSQRIEVISRSGGLAGVELDGVEDRNGQTIVHQPVAGANAPQRRSANHVSCALPCVLDNTIARADVV